VVSGNLLTHYNYRRSRLESGPGRVRSALPDGTPTLELAYDLEAPDGPPDGSPFADWREARRFAGPMPFTFDVERSGGVVVIEGRRASWEPRPFRVIDWQIGLFDEPPLCDAEPLLANAFAVHDVDYRWERGRLLRCG
jgi:hypothetical protein